MGKSDRRIDVLLEKATVWQAERRFLRAILLTTELDETFKWREAAYTLAGENVVMISHRKANCGLAFFRGALLGDAKQILVAPGPNTRGSREILFASLEELQAAEPVIRAYIAEAIQIHKDGRKVDFTVGREMALPDVLTKALAEDDALSQAWDALTPGRQRSWMLHIGAAKQEKTKQARLAKGRAKILSGKGQTER